MESEPHIKNIFSMFDKDNDGHILSKELGTVLRLIGHSPTNEEIQAITKKMDQNDTGLISYQHFLAVNSMKDLMNDSGNDLREAFRVFDKDGNGYISVNELRQVLLHLGEKLSEEEFHDIIREGGLERNGKIWYNDIISTILRN